MIPDQARREWLNLFVQIKQTEKMHFSAHLEFSRDNVEFIIFDKLNNNQGFTVYDFTFGSSGKSMTKILNMAITGLNRKVFERTRDLEL